MKSSAWKTEKFVKVMEFISSKLSIDLLDIPNFEKNENIGMLEVRPSVLFRWASTLSFSSDNDARAYSLKIAHFLILSDDLDEKSRLLGFTLLKRLNNRTSANLALERALIPEQSVNENIFSKLNQLRVDFNSTYEINGEDLYLNYFQGELLSAIKSYMQVAVSAPTSAGKSFIVERWIAQAFTDGAQNIALVVPTRALIHQMEMDMRKVLKKFELSDIQIVTVPSNIFFSVEKKNLFIFTQERFHIYQNLLSHKEIISALIVDEAQKISDGSRGILLQQVIETAVHTNNELKIIFLTPSSQNPEVLIVQGHGTNHVVNSSEVTVGQNLYWVTQRPRMPSNWKLSLLLKSSEITLGNFSLENKPIKTSQRLSYVAFHVAGTDPGNIVFVNGPAESEKIAWQLSELMRLSGFEADKDLEELIKFVKDSIHPKYMLANTLKYGVAFHYGNIPLLIKSEVERLFSIGKIRYLVCTSTLVEGVNTACRNLFLRGPKRGNSTKMDSLDFWNLAGRAGRWGKEFEGNIFCIDADVSDLWLDGAPPKSKQKFRIVKALDRELNDGESLLESLAIQSPSRASPIDANSESTINYLFNRYYQTGRNEDFMTSSDLRTNKAEEIQNAISIAASQITVNEEIINRNPGINPIYMQRLLNYFQERGHKPEEFLPPSPDSFDAVESLGLVFARTYTHLGSSLGPATFGRSFALALLVVNWMRGRPVRTMIDNQIRYNNKKNRNIALATTIRNVLNDIEQFARYEAPKYISCYTDILNQYYNEIGCEELSEELEDFNLYLEFGASQITQISLMSLGLSRATSIQLSEFIVNDKLNQEEVLKLLKELDLDSFSFSSLMKTEITSLLNN